MKNALLDEIIDSLIREFGRDSVLTSVQRRPLSSTDVKSVPKSKSKGERRPEGVNTLAAIANEFPSKVGSIQILLDRFKRKEFLSTTRETEEFIEAKTGQRTRLSSRSKATSKLMQALASLSLTELESLRALGTVSVSDHSDLSVIAKEVLGNRDHKVA